MKKEHILAEIKRTANANNGVPLGRQRFYAETEVKHSDWYGKYWVTWSDALSEAGFMPNQMAKAYSSAELIEKFVGLIRELGHIPVDAEMIMKARQDQGFPSRNTFSRLGPKHKLILKAAEYCKENIGFEDVLSLCLAAKTPERIPLLEESLSSVKMGYVYLIKHGSRKEYKIGKTFDPLRREGEISLQLPETPETIHSIQTDDPSGIEAYWHRRFASKRKQGEWFALTSLDVQAFKRWKRIF